jgi:predicted esterase
LKCSAAGVVSFSGMLLYPDDDISDNSDNSEIKIFLAHGEKDSVIPIECFTMTEEALKNLGAGVESALSPDLEHGIDDYLMRRAVDFLKRL